MTEDSRSGDELALRILELFSRWERGSVIAAKTGLLMVEVAALRHAIITDDLEQSGEDPAQIYAAYGIRK